MDALTKPCRQITGLAWTDRSGAVTIETIYSGERQADLLWFIGSDAGVYSGGVNSGSCAMRKNWDLLEFLQRKHDICSLEKVRRQWSVPVLCTALCLAINQFCVPNVGNDRWILLRGQVLLSVVEEKLWQHIAA